MAQRVTIVAPGRPRVDQRVPEMQYSPPKWPNEARRGQRGAKEGPRVAQEWLRVAQSGPYWPRVHQRAQEWLRVAKSRLEVPRMD